MADDFEFAEDEEQYESDDEADDEAFYEADDESEDEAESGPSARRYALRALGVPVPPSAPPGIGYSIASRVAPYIKGVRAAMLRSGNTSAVMRFPTAVPTLGGVRQLARRGVQTEAVVADHERRLRSGKGDDRRSARAGTAALVLQHLRDVVAQARMLPAATLGAAGPGALATVEYTLATSQAACTVAAVPRSVRGVGRFVPAASGLISSGAREVMRLSAGGGAPAWTWWMAATIGVPTLVGAVGSFILRRRRPRYRRYY